MIIKQQESSLFRTTGKSFEKNYILHGYYINVFSMKARFVKIYHFYYIYLYADFVIE